MRKQIKKILTVLLVAVGAVAFAALSTCAGVLFVYDNATDTSSTYEGALNAQGYDTADDAAKAYLAQEFSGAEMLVFEKYEKKKLLSRNEIKKLSLGECKPADVQSAEEGEITYFEAAVNESKRDESMSLTKPTLLLKIDGKYHYYALYVQDDEKLTISCYALVYGMSNYNSFYISRRKTD